jgi:hypothetical protein
MNKSAIRKKTPLINAVGPKKGDYHNYLSETLDVSGGHGASFG